MNWYAVIILAVIIVTVVIVIVANPGGILTSFVNSEISLIIRKIVWAALHVSEETIAENKENTQEATVQPTKQRPHPDEHH